MVSSNAPPEQNQDPYGWGAPPSQDAQHPQTGYPQGGQPSPYGPIPPQGGAPQGAPPTQSAQPSLYGPIPSHGPSQGEPPQAFPQGAQPPVYGQPPFPGYPQPSQPQYYGPAAGYPVRAPPLRAQPLPGRWVQPPATQPLPGQVLLYYEPVAPETGCCRCEGLNAAGLITIILMFVFGVPCLAFIPCCMPECFEPMQRPVYGYPSGAMPVGVPPPGYN
eukprot:TRINITY_DN4151_c0_g1_i1.p1 TRINITY_DN4151_c0_g1~~TRINITY_DN4151_c0_g1_i1.p1  ORF type:complete len:218 (-),score=21.21 TRINITY_DN4151_c0_g1_i1:1003-1656(-)